VYDDGRQSRDFTHVANVVQANVLAACAPKLGGESVNVAAGEPRSVLELLRAIADVFGYWLEPEFLPARLGDIRDSHADISLARTLLHYAPVTGFAEGLEETIASLRDRA
jgi:UDP-glucose 4-epimerase